jgi:hypothetical protein
VVCLTVHKPLICHVDALQTEKFYDLIGSTSFLVLTVGSLALNGWQAPRKVRISRGKEGGLGSVGALQTGCWPVVWPRQAQHHGRLTALTFALHCCAADLGKCHGSSVGGAPGQLPSGTSAQGRPQVCHKVTRYLI